jgi:hypothetical protein
MTEEFAEQRGQRRIPTRQSTRPFHLVELGDEVFGDSGVEVAQSRRPCVGAAAALVLRLIFKVATSRHGAVDKRAIPCGAISKGERATAALCK